MAYVLSTFVAQLPLLVVLIAGFVLVSRRRAWLGPRSALLGLTGLGVLTLELVMSWVWTIMFPRLIDTFDLSATGLGLVSGVIGMILSVITAVGIGLLIAALVTRPARQAPPVPPAFPPAQAPRGPSGSAAG